MNRLILQSSKLLLIRLILVAMVFGVLIIPGIAKGATINALSCSQADVQAAIDSASDGDTVMVPAGSCTWTTQAVNKPSVEIFEKGIILQGAGIDQTIVTDATGNSHNESALRLKSVTNIRITGFTFLGDGGYKGVIAVNDSRDIRIDHCNFDLLKSRAIVSYNTFGVVDNCVFEHGSIEISSTGDLAWTEPYEFGSKDALFVENNNFLYTPEDKEGGMISGHTGSRWVFRHNQVTNAGMNNHGACTSKRSSMVMEVYDNLWTATPDIGNPITLRGGTGVIFSNTFTGYKTSPQAALRLINYRSYRTDGLCGDLGVCDGNNILDGNMAGMQGYACLDQVGRAGPDTGKGTPQPLVPAFEWNNKINENDDMDFVVSSEGRNPLHIQPSRDYYSDTDYYGNPIGYDPLTDIYSAKYLDDDGTIKDWAYKPYTYPHPLTNTTPTPLTITTASLSTGTLSSPYSQTLSATGGTSPYSWSLSSGTLPGGLSLSSSSVISGTLTQEGTFNFTVQVQDSASSADTDTKDLSITVNPDTSPSTTTTVTDTPTPTPTTLPTTTSTTSFTTTTVKPAPPTTSSTSSTTTIPSSTTSTDSTTTIPWVCPVIISLEEDDEGVELIRAFSRKVLVKSMVGREYIDLYYRHAAEVSILLLSDPDLRTEMAEVLNKLLPEIESILRGEEVLTFEITDEIASLLDEIEAEASPGLRRAIKRVRKDMVRGRVFKQLGVKVVE